jgi:hypothetical protein
MGAFLIELLFSIIPRSNYIDLVHNNLYELHTQIIALIQMEAEIHYNISSPEIASNFLANVVSTASVVKAAGCTVCRHYRIPTVIDTCWVF